MKVKINGWVGKWNAEKKYLFSPLTLTVDAQHVVLFDNKKGTALKAGPVTDDGKPELGPNDVELRQRNINVYGPRYGVYVLGTRFELDLEEDEYNRLSKLILSENVDPSGSADIPAFD